MTFIGDKQTVGIDLEWYSRSEDMSAASQTRGYLSLWLNDRVIWGLLDRSEPSGMRGIDWTWIELLEGLAENWRFLLWEQETPIPVSFDRVSYLISDARRRWESLGAQKADQEAESLYEFEQRHNLAAYLQGIKLPSVYFVRRGKWVMVESGDSVLQVTFAQAINVLEASAQAIIGKLQVIAETDGRAKAAIHAWEKKAFVNTPDYVSISTGIPVREVKALAGRKDIMSYWGLGADEPLEDNDILAVARMAYAGGLTRVALSKLLSFLKSEPKVNVEILDSLSVEAEALISERGRGLRSFEQGYILAEWLRSKWRLRPSDRCMPRLFLSQWGVRVQLVDLGAPSVDAVACWGKNAGPSIFANTMAMPHKRHNRIQTTLAHEICHLLIDRRSALPLAEVQNGMAIPSVEARARAFAAELLAPRKTVGAAFRAITDQVEAHKRLHSLSKQYNVSAEVLVWQTKNSHAAIHADVWDALRRKVPESRDF